MRPAGTSRGAGLTAAALLFLGALGPSTAVGLGNDQALAVSQAAIGKHVGDITLIDSTGDRHRLHELLDRPVGISLIYTGCAHSCSITTRYLDRVVTTARKALDADSFRMITIGFDFGVDTPEAMANHARRHGVDDPHWLFAVAEERSGLDALIDDLGFVHTPSARGFDHTVQVSLLDRDATVYRQVYGETFDAPQLVEPLKDLVWRRPNESDTLLGSIGKRIRLFCTVYDARGDRYYFDYSMFMGMLFGGVFILGIGAWTWREMLLKRRRRA